MNLQSGVKGVLRLIEPGGSRTAGQRADGEGGGEGGVVWDEFWHERFMLNHMHIPREHAAEAKQFYIEENNSVYIPHTSPFPESCSPEQNPVCVKMFI